MKSIFSSCLLFSTQPSSWTCLHWMNVDFLLNLEFRISPQVLNERLVSLSSSRLTISCCLFLPVVVWGKNSFSYVYTKWHLMPNGENVLNNMLSLECKTRRFWDWGTQCWKLTDIRGFINILLATHFLVYNAGLCSLYLAWLFWKKLLFLDDKCAFWFQQGKMNRSEIRPNPWHAHKCHVCIYKMIVYILLLKIYQEKSVFYRYTNASLIKQQLC